MKTNIPIINSYRKYQSWLEGNEDFNKKQAAYNKYLTDQDLTIEHP